MWGLPALPGNTDHTADTVQGRAQGMKRSERRREKKRGDEEQAGNRKGTAREGGSHPAVCEGACSACAASFCCLLSITDLHRPPYSPVFLPFRLKLSGEINRGNWKMQATSTFHSRLGLIRILRPLCWRKLFAH